jgi:hypothetical protein
MRYNRSSALKIVFIAFCNTNKIGNKCNFSVSVIIYERWLFVMYIGLFCDDTLLHVMIMLCMAINFVFDFCKSNNSTVDPSCIGCSLIDGVVKPINL